MNPNYIIKIDCACEATSSYFTEHVVLFDIHAISLKVHPEFGAEAIQGERDESEGNMNILKDDCMQPVTSIKMNMGI